MTDASHAPRGGARTLLVVLPLFTVAVVSFALFVVGTPRPVTSARMWMGPTEGVSRLTPRVAVIERYRGIESPAEVGAIEVVAKASDGRGSSWSGEIDERGLASPVLDFGSPIHGPVTFWISARGKPLADGRVQLTPEEWRTRMRELGGWIAHGSRSGDLLVQIAAGRGALAVPFEEPLLIEVRNANGPVRNAKLSFEPDGLVVSERDTRLITDVFGRAVVRVTPREHVVSLRVNAVQAEAKGSWFGRLPILPGALEARLDGDGDALVIVSPIPRDLAYWSLITADRGVARGSARLESTPDGFSTARVPLPALPDGPLWAIVSSEPELDSASTVGWPLRPALPGAEPSRARIVNDPLLADGTFRAEATDGRRRTYARWLAGGVTLLAALLVGLLLSLESRRSRKVLDAHLEQSLLEDDAAERISDKPARFWTIVVALLCVALGFLVVAIVALYRIE